MYISFVSGINIFTYSAKVINQFNKVFFAITTSNFTSETANIYCNLDRIADLITVFSKGTCVICLVPLCCIIVLILVNIMS